MNAERWIKALILTLISGLCVGYICNPVIFSKLHIEIPGLNFPVFIGEIVFTGCFLLTCIGNFLNPPRWKWAYGFVVIFYAFVIWKAWNGYKCWGALAFRNAALFYYSFFAFIVYYAVRDDFPYPRPVGYGAILLLAGLIGFRIAGMDYYFSCLVVGICVLLSFKNKIKYYLIPVFFFLALLNFQSSARGVLIGFLTGMIFFFLMMFFSWRTVRFKYRTNAFIAVVAVILVVVWFRADRNALRSMFSLEEYFSSFNSLEVIVEENSDVILPGVPVKVYQEVQQKPNRPPSPPTQMVKKSPDELANELIRLKNRIHDQLSRVKELKQEQQNVDLGELQQQLAQQQNNLQDALSELEGGKKRSLGQVESTILNIKQQNQKLEQEIILKRSKYRSLKTAKGNVVWRMFVWKDMFSELIQSKKILGVDFGFPFRSRSLEILSIVTGNDWARGHWVGWIEPHNSFIHILYRAGIMGLFYIVGIFLSVLVMVWYFVSNRDVRGMLLVSGAVYWLVHANFSVILEVPYFAIPFWALLGGSLGYYRHRLRQTDGCKLENRS